MSPTVSLPDQGYLIVVEPDLLQSLALALRALHRDTEFAGNSFDPRLADLERDLNRLGRLQWAQDKSARIDTTEAALILQCTTRRVCQQAKELGGVKVKSRYQFQRQLVEDFAAEKPYRPRKRSHKVKL
jgi:hypothetical protein